MDRLLTISNDIDKPINVRFFYNKFSLIIPALVITVSFTDVDLLLLLLAAAIGCCYWLLLLAAAIGCCCWLQLLAAAIDCCCWLLLLAAAVGCCCWLLLLAAAAAIGCCYWPLPLLLTAVNLLYCIVCVEAAMCLLRCAFCDVPSPSLVGVFVSCGVFVGVVSQLAVVVIHRTCLYVRDTPRLY